MAGGLPRQCSGPDQGCPDSCQTPRGGHDCPRGVARRPTTRRGDGTLAWLRERNRERVVGVLRTLGRTSQADIARSTGLSRTTVSTLVAELKVSGLAFEADGKASGQRGGRPRGPLGLQGP